jgi:hypothetical protein
LQRAVNRPTSITPLEVIMPFVSTPDRFRRMTAGAALILSPFAFAAAELLGPEPANDGRQALGIIADHRPAALAAALLSITVTMLLLAGTLALVHLIRGRGVTYANLAIIFIGYGLVTAHAALGGVNLVFREMTAPGMDRSAMAALYNSITSDPAAGAPLLLGNYAFVVGLVLLAVALLRARVGPQWAAWCVLLFPVSDIVLSAVPVEHLDDLVSNAFGVAGFGALGLHLLRMSDAHWVAPAVHPASSRRTSSTGTRRTGRSLPAA